MNVNIPPATSKAILTLLVFESGLSNTGTEKRVSQQSVYETVWDGIDLIENN